MPVYWRSIEFFTWIISLKMDLNIIFALEFAQGELLIF